MALIKKKSDKWFKKVRRSYLPRNWKGWAVYVPLVAMAGLLILSAYYQDGLVIGILLKLVLELIGLGTIFTLIAKRKS